MFWAHLQTHYQFYNKTNSSFVSTVISDFAFSLLFIQLFHNTNINLIPEIEL